MPFNAVRLKPSGEILKNCHYKCDHVRMALMVGKGFKKPLSTNFQITQKQGLAISAIRYGLGRQIDIWGLVGGVGVNCYNIRPCLCIWLYRFAFYFLPKNNLVLIPKFCFSFTFLLIRNIVAV